MAWTDAFAPHEARYRSQVMQETWGHLAPKKNKRYKGRIVYAVGCFGSDHLNPYPTFCEFDDLDSSPWFYHSLIEFLENQENEPGCIYEFVGTFRNYEFVGQRRLLIDTNKA